MRPRHDRDKEQISTNIMGELVNNRQSTMNVKLTQNVKGAG